MAAGMGDGGAERDRGPARRESRGGRGGDRGGAEDSGVDAGRRSPREIAGTAASSRAGSRESGADSDGQPGLGEADHCRRILVRGKRTARGPGPPDPHPTPYAASSPSSHTQPVNHHSVIHSLNIILSVYCVLTLSGVQGTKRRTEPGRSPCQCLTVLSLSGRPLTLGPSQPVTVAGAQMQARDAESRSPPRVHNGGCGEKRHERSAGSGPGRTSVRNHGRKRPALRSAAWRVPAARPASFPLPSDTDRSGCSRKRAPGRGGRRAPRLPAWASLFRLALPRGAWARPALGAAFPGLAFRVSPFLPRPSPSSLLAWPFLSAELSSALFSCKRFRTAPQYPALPGLSLPGRDFPDPQASLTRSSRHSFRRIRASPREVGGERGFGVSPSACP